MRAICTYCHAWLNTNQPQVTADRCVRSQRVLKTTPTGMTSAYCTHVNRALQTHLFRPDTSSSERFTRAAEVDES